MFFAESLGPALNAVSAQALVKFVRERHAQSSIPLAELRGTVGEFLRLTHNSTPVDSVVKFLASRGVAAPDGSNFKIAA